MPGKNKNKHGGPMNRWTPQRLEALKRAQQALELRMAARTWQEIAEALNYKTPAGPINAVKALLKSSLAVPVEEYRALNSERLIKIIQVHWPSMLKKDMGSAGVIMRCIQQLSGLMGLEAPVRITIDLRSEAEKVAKEMGLSVEDVLREAEAVIRAAAK